MHSLIAITTGARREEILGLQWSHIGLEQNIAHFKETKNGKPRSVALSDTVVAELKKLHGQRHSHKPLVFASSSAFGKVNIKRSGQRALKKAEIVSLRFHDLWHIFATHAARRGASNLELATAMGTVRYSCFSATRISILKLLKNLATTFPNNFYELLYHDYDVEFLRKYK